MSLLSWHLFLGRFRLEKPVVILQSVLGKTKRITKGIVVLFDDRFNSCSLLDQERVTFSSPTYLCLFFYLGYLNYLKFVFPCIYALPDFKLVFVAITLEDLRQV